MGLPFGGIYTTLEWEVVIGPLDRIKAALKARVPAGLGDVELAVQSLGARKIHTNSPILRFPLPVYYEYVLLSYVVCTYSLKIV